MMSKIFSICILIVFTLLTITGCRIVGIRLSISDNNLNIAIKNFPKEEVEEDYFDLNSYFTLPTAPVGNYEYSAGLYVVMSEESRKKCKIDFNGGIYLVDTDGIFVAVTDQFISDHMKTGWSIDLKREGEYTISLNSLPENYKVKDILYVVYCDYKEYKDSNKNNANIENHICNYGLYKLPVKESVNIDGNIIITPDFEKKKSYTLNSVYIAGSPLLRFMSDFSTSGERSISELYTILSE